MIKITRIIRPGAIDLFKHFIDREGETFLSDAFKVRLDQQPNETYVVSAIDDDTILFLLLGYVEGGRFMLFQTTIHPQCPKALVLTMLLKVFFFCEQLGIEELRFTYDRNPQEILEVLSPETVIQVYQLNVAQASDYLLAERLKELSNERSIKSDGDVDNQPAPVQPDRNPHPGPATALIPANGPNRPRDAGIVQPTISTSKRSDSQSIGDVIAGRDGELYQELGGDTSAAAVRDDDSAVSK